MSAWSGSGATRPLERDPRGEVFAGSRCWYWFAPASSPHPRPRPRLAPAARWPCGSSATELWRSGRLRAPLEDAPGLLYCHTSRAVLGIAPRTSGAPWSGLYRREVLGIEFRGAPEEISVQIGHSTRIAFCAWQKAPRSGTPSDRRPARRAQTSRHGDSAWSICARARGIGRSLKQPVHTVGISRSGCLAGCPGRLAEVWPPGRVAALPAVRVFLPGCLAASPPGEAATMSQVPGTREKSVAPGSCNFRGREACAWIGILSALDG